MYVCTLKKLLSFILNELDNLQGSLIVRMHFVNSNTIKNSKILFGNLLHILQLKYKLMINIFYIITSKCFELSNSMLNKNHLIK